MSAPALVLIEGHQVRTHKCDDGFPGVVVADVLSPLGKRVDSTKGLWEGWARVRKFRLPSRTGAEKAGYGALSGNEGETTLMHAEDVPLLIARLDQRGMPVDTKAMHTRFLVTCRDVLAAAFYEKPSGISPEQIAAIATQSALAAVVPLMDRLLERERMAREESRLIIGGRRARAILDEIGSTACIHAQRGSKAWRKTHRRVSNDVRDALRLPNAGSWASLPERFIPEIEAELVKIRKRETERPREQTELGTVVDFKPRRGA